MTVAFNYLGKLGQLGNQMFQYAATLGIARKLGVSFMIPNHDEVFVDPSSNRLRIELFDCFNIKPDSIGYLKTNNVLAEKGFEFNNNILNVDHRFNFTLHGFFQTEKYFKHCENEIRKQYSFKKQIIDECKKIIEECFDNPIALHIRRTDYLTNSNHIALDLDYYKKSLDKFDSKRQVVIFSDDSQWCMEQELFSDDRFLISDATGPYHDLYMMSQCNDFIIANSSFSWWGAWLANRGKVIAPKKWFGPNNAHLNTKDLYCDNWEIL
jgi:hypothetical protein